MELVGSIKKGRNGELRVVVDRFKGRITADLRVWCTTPEQTGMRRTGRGVQFDVKKLDALIEILQLAKVKAEAMRSVKETGS